MQKVKIKTSPSGRNPVKVWIDDTEIQYVKDVLWNEHFADKYPEVTLTFVARIENEEWSEWEPGKYKTESGHEAVVSIVDIDGNQLLGYIKDDYDIWRAAEWYVNGHYASALSGALDLVK